MREANSPINEISKIKNVVISFSDQGPREQDTYVALASSEEMFESMPAILTYQAVGEEKELLIGAERILETSDDLSAALSELPDSSAFLSMLRAALRVLATGKAVSLVPGDAQLTTGQTADLLNVSRPYVVKLTISGELPSTMVGTHRRIRFEDIVKYKAQRDERRENGIKRLFAMYEADLNEHARKGVAQV